MNTTQAYIQDENGILKFEYCNISYEANVNSEKSRLACIKQLRENTRRNFRWFKETTGNNHWVIYDSNMYEISDKYDSNFLGLEKYTFLHYREESGLEPELPINATSCHGMFYQCNLIESWILEKESFDTTYIVTMFGMFNSCYGLKYLDVSASATPNLEDMAEMLCDCISLEEIDFRNIDTSKVTDMERLFKGCYSLTNVLLTGLDTSNVIYTTCMFKGCNSVEELDLRSFSTVSVTEAEQMFAYCYNLAKIIISNKWNMSEMYEDDYMFDECEKLPNYNKDRLGAEMAKSIEQGGYLTLV